MTDYIHFDIGLSGEASRQSKPIGCITVKRSYPLCRNGNFHAEGTTDRKAVDCPYCRKILEDLPDLLKRTEATVAWNPLPWFLSATGRFIFDDRFMKPTYR